MDLYTLERWTLERHHEQVGAAEENNRVRGWTLRPRVAELLAVNLRRLADRLDGPYETRDRKFTVVSGSR
jgi:hypothetical protein